MWAWLDHIGLVVLDAAAGAIVLLALSALAIVVCRQPARRLLFARAAVVALVALIPLEALNVVPRVEVLDVVRNVAMPVRALRDQVQVLRQVHLPRTVPEGVYGHVVVSLRRAIVLTYLAGVGCWAGWSAIGHLGLRWLARRTRPAGSTAQTLYQAIPTRFTSRPRLLVSERCTRPVLVGVVRRLILIPPELDPAGPDDPACTPLRLSLLHELAHAEAGDPWFTLLGQVAQAFWYVLPPTWWVLRVMRLDQEFLADHRAALRFGASEGYASVLLQVAAQQPARHPQVASLPPGHVPGSSLSTVGGEGSSSLFHRIAMLVRCPFSLETDAPRWLRLAIPTLTVFATFSASSLSFRARSDSIPVTSGTTAFYLADLEVSASPGGLNGRAQFLELPLQLPEQFELNLEVYGDQASLALTRIAGLPLALIAPLPFDDGQANWHQVRLKRDASGVTFELDAQPLLLPPGAYSINSWLTLEPPPDHGALFRSLNLVW